MLSVVDNDTQHTSIQHNNKSNVTLSIMSITYDTIILSLIVLRVVYNDTQHPDIQHNNKSNMALSNEYRKWNYHTEYNCAVCCG
jgi:hypothetical protein